MCHPSLKTGLLLLIGAACIGSVIAGAAGGQSFDQQIAPLIAQRCLSCHSGKEPKGKLDLSSRAAAMAGGESGNAIVPGNLDKSLLWEHIDSDEMPPDKPLPAAEKTLLKNWLATGATWGTDEIDPFRVTTDSRAGYNWWSLQPLTNPQPPTAQRAGWENNPIDAFVYARLAANGLFPSVEADKRILIRRLSFDLLGLPPTPQQIREFLADASADSYEQLVDRMLASPHYGERWARHWLDVIRFGESNGFEYDQPRDNAWHYRNWVINALNQDMPYDEFVRLQLAGDVLHPKDPHAIAAAGFLVAGPHNTTLPASQKMRLSMAQDELEDLVAVVGQTFLGLTVNCARCHDHKFDPISQQEYYQLAATVAGVKHGERTVQGSVSPDQQRRIVDIDARLATLRKEIHGIEQPIRTAILCERDSGKASGPEPPKAFATWEFDGDLTDRRGELDAQAKGGAQAADGFLVLDGKSSYAATKPVAIALDAKTLEAWVQLDDLEQRGGGVISLQTTNGAIFDAIVFGEKEPRKWMAGSNWFGRTRPFGGEEQHATSRPIHMALVYDKQGNISAYRDGRPYGKPYRPGPLQHYAAGSAQVVFGMRHSPAGGNKMFAGRIQRAQLYNRALTPEEVAASAGVADGNYVPESKILARLSADNRKNRTQFRSEIERLSREKGSLTNTAPRKIYTCVSSNPGVTRVLRRGNVADPAEPVSPSGLRAVVGIESGFGIAQNASDGDRRRKLAEWVTHRDNALFARVIVNRLWYYHFGRGLVTTPSDFGYNGGKPSHPELLDWLAEALRRHEYRLKPVHRLIVTSAAYRQSSKPDAAAAKVDGNNRLVWRKSPQRLEAEAIRDAVLLVAGQLDLEIGGKGYRDVRHFKFKGSNFYEPLAEIGTEKRRRTIYRFAPRGGRNPFLDTFDCPDPSTTAPQRARTTTPLQALALMNNALIFQMADLLSQRAVRETGDQVDQQVSLVLQWAYGRPVGDDEVRRAARFVAEQGLPAFCRVVFNSNEFVFVQ